MRNFKYCHIVRIMSCESNINNQIGKLKRIFSNESKLSQNTHYVLIKTKEIFNTSVKSKNLTLEEAKQALDNGYKVFNRNWFLSDELPHINKINGVYRYCDYREDTDIDYSMDYLKDWFIFVDENSYFSSHEVA